ncbi:MAG: class I tRNA ligase family protein, partial [Deltaproteobacteria bacterium]|nr:class I tRNA ligase family protein [Deltaproteobacteria bacterium]
EWMNNIQDWCISRQLWWGHRIPVWYCQSCREVIVSEHDVTTCPACGSHQLEMDTDVLDTWFSSGLWPFSTMGWPEETDDLKTFYPTAVLVTGYDILFFWVARMAMLGLKFMGREPFRQVLLHGLLRDQFGEKMSKTKGNGLDPLDMIEKYGADALRYTLSAGTVLGRDMVLQESAIEGNRNFINKVWNATRYLQGHVEKLGPPARLEQVAPGRFDSWILGRLGQTAKEIRSYLHQRRFNEACRVLYAFTWHEFCDWYVEISKPVLSGTLGPEPQKAALATLRYTLDQVLRLLHPFMPFVTEELWAALPGNEGYLMVQPYPGAPGGMPLTEETPAGLEQAATLIDLVQTVRTVRGENGIKPRVLLEATIAAGSELQALIREEEQTILTLAGLENITLVESFDQREGYGHGVGDGYEVFLLLAGAVDVDAEKQRIGREIEKTRSRITQLSAKLDNPAFIDKAPRQVIEKNREELGALQTQLAKLTDSLQQLSGG